MEEVHLVALKIPAHHRGSRKLERLLLPRHMTDEAPKPKIKYPVTAGFERPRQKKLHHNISLAIAKPVKQGVTLYPWKGN
jgi:hypothetical protein